MTTDQDIREAVERLKVAAKKRRELVAQDVRPYAIAEADASVGDVGLVDLETVLAERDKLSAENAALEKGAPEFWLVRIAKGNELLNAAEAKLTALSAELERENAISAERWGAKQELLVEVAGLRAKLTALVEMAAALLTADDKFIPSFHGACSFDNRMALAKTRDDAAFTLRQALAHHSAPVGEDQAAAQRAYIEAVALEFGGKLPGDAWHLYRQKGLTPAQAAAEHRRIVSASAPPTTPTSAPVEDVGGVHRIAEMLAEWLDTGTQATPEIMASRILAALSPSLIQPQAAPEGEGGWRPIAELTSPAAPVRVDVRTARTYRWLPYKPDGARQMKKAGRWQAASQYGWENAELPERGEFKPNQPQVEERS